MEFEIEIPRQSFASWILNSLGWEFAILLPLVGLLSFVMAIVVVMKGKGPFVGPALLFIVSVPMLLGLFGAIQGAIQSYSVISMSSTTVKPSEVAAGISAALVVPMVGMVLMAPSFAVAMFGSFLRSLLVKSDQAANFK